MSTSTVFATTARALLAAALLAHAPSPLATEGGAEAGRAAGAAPAGLTPPPDLRFLATFKGKCVSARLNGKDVTGACKPAVVNAGYTTSRLAYIFSVESPVVMSGETGSPPDLGHRSLRVTVISFEPGRRLPAKGQCGVRGDPMKGATFACEAVTLDGSASASFAFESQGPPVVFRAEDAAPAEPARRRETAPR